MAGLQNHILAAKIVAVWKLYTCQPMLAKPIRQALYKEQTMAQATFHFPRGFLWGTATASHQVEGNSFNNNWWAWEQQAGHILQGDKSGLACDWWAGRWRDDFDRAAAAGQNAHRLSVEWSRVQPAPDRWDENAIDRYIEMMRGLYERRITPMVTLHHFTDPLWLEELGGWENEKVAQYFSAYVERVVEALRNYTSLWVTINEPNVLSVSAYLAGIWPPGVKSASRMGRVMANLIRAHAAAYNTIHRLQPQAKVGMAINYRPFKPLKSWSPVGRLAARLINQIFNETFPTALSSGSLRFPGWLLRIPEARGTQDYLGINYYTLGHISGNVLNLRQNIVKPPFPHGTEVSPSGMFANEPSGMFQALKWGLKFDVPIYVTENGIEDKEDRLRPRYLIQHLHQVWRAVNFNYPVRGYFHWTLVDNFEWDRGWSQRFGLWELDVESQVRRKRLSADLYAEICRENGISSDMVQRYAPEIIDGMFPD
jgi:beta-glucosidase